MPTDTQPLSYWDAPEDYVPRDGATLVRSGAGYGSGPEYRECWLLRDGRYLYVTRHQDRGGLETGELIQSCQSDDAWLAGRSA